jgi:hypothetical protein
MLACVRHIDRCGSKRGSGKTEKDVIFGCQTIVSESWWGGVDDHPAGKGECNLLRRGLSLPRTLPYKPRPPHASRPERISREV